MRSLPAMTTQVHRLSVSQLAEAARNSTWKLPAYQRPLVWEPEQALRLVQSVYEGYPIGAMLVWSRSWTDHILLDGQQRLAALTGIRCGTTEPGPQVGWSFLGEGWALGPQDEEDTWLTLRWWQETDAYDRVMRLGDLREKFGDARWGLAVDSIDRLIWAIAPIHVLERATAEQAVEAFRRLNVEGTPIDLDELTRLLAEEG